MKPHRPTPSHEEIAARAGEIWRIAGRPRGRDPEFWLAAQARLNHEREELLRALNEVAPEEPSAA